MKRLFKTLLLLLVLFGAFIYLEKNYQITSMFNLEAVSEKDNEVFVEELRKAMLDGEETVQLQYRGPGDTLEAYLVEALDQAFAIDNENTTDDHDYLRYKLSGTKMDMKGIGSSYQITYTFDYLESKKETEEVNQEIKKILQTLKIESMNSYEKAKAVHDFIIDNCTYDMTINRNSAYAALIEESSVCQGYAQLTYKMMKEVGVPCRVITGTADGQPHAWNIVKLGKYWYNVDCTWDDPIGGDGRTQHRYDFFLKGNTSFSKHIRDSEFSSEEFNMAYPMDVVAYNPSE